MDTRDAIPAPLHSYTLWHIPSSTLLLTTSIAGEVAGWLRHAIAEGLPEDDLMLQVTDAGQLVGHQFLGSRILPALAGDDAGPEMALGTA